CASSGGLAVGQAVTGGGMLGGRRGGWVRWFFSGVWLVYLIAPVAGLFGKGHGPLWIAGGITLAVVFCVVYIAVLGHRQNSLTRGYVSLAGRGSRVKRADLPVFCPFRSVSPVRGWSRLRRASLPALRVLRGVRRVRWRWFRVR